MAKRTKLESQRLQDQIELLERTAVERGTPLKTPGEYEELFFELRKQAGEIAQDVTIAQARDRHSPLYVRELKAISDKVRNRQKKAKAEKLPAQQRFDKYHVYLDKKRTTATVHPILSTLLALKLGQTPGTAAARKAVKKWLQKQLDTQDKPVVSAASFWLQEQVILYLSGREMQKRYKEWIS